MLYNAITLDHLIMIFFFPAEALVCALTASRPPFFAALVSVMRSRRACCCKVAQGERKKTLTRHTHIWMAGNSGGVATIGIIGSSSAVTMGLGEGMRLGGTRLRAERSSSGAITVVDHDVLASL